MDLDDLRRRLAEHSPGRLAEELVHLAGRDRAVRRRLELLATEGDSAGLAAALRRRVAGLKRAQSFVPYRDSFNFARDLEALVDSVRRGLLDTDPESACSVLEAFIEADAATFERSDDSSGSIGDAFREACRLLLQAAARAESDRDWVGRIYELVQEDDYGVREALLKHAADLLSELELRRLARRFEDDARAMASAPEKESYARGTALAYQSLVAEALRDPRLYERSISTRGGALNDLQRLDVARHYLEYGQPREAERHLRSVAGGGHERWKLLADCYEQTGQQAERIDCLWKLFELGLAWGDFEELSALLAEEDRKAARERARRTALAADDTVRAATFLLQLGCVADAERLVVDRRDALEGHFYVRLAQLAKLAAERKAHRIEVFCYRALLEDILTEGRSRAYGHAAGYLKRLGELDGIVESAPAVDHEEYVGWLRDRHGRKSAFWRRVEASS